MKTKTIILRILCWSLAAGATARAASQPPAIFLTWQRDPTTTMTIDWHTEGEAESLLRYRRDGEEQWRLAEGDRRPFPFTERVIHRVELTQLDPGALYRFTVGDFERVYAFRTISPDPGIPLVFALGGDTRHNQEWMERTNRVALRHRPDFIVWGGDLAYADGLPRRFANWFEWFDAIRNTLIEEDGRIVPIVVGIGNHEVQGGYIRAHPEYEPTDEWRERIAPYFYQLFAFPGQPGYGVLDFGERLSLIMLDTQHTNPIPGAQTEWLAAVLAGRGRVAHVFPVYHVPAYPSVRGFGGGRAIREHWSPLFERHGVRWAFENHDHAYKRTVPIRNGAPDPDGVVYLGDGAWGVGVRAVHSVEDTWYLEKAQSIRHVLIVTLRDGERSLEVYCEEGELIDRIAPGSDEMSAMPRSCSRRAFFSARPSPRVLLHRLHGTRALPAAPPSPAECRGAGAGGPPVACNPSVGPILQSKIDSPPPLQLNKSSARPGSSGPDSRRRPRA